MEPGLNFGKDQNCPAIRTSCRSSSFSPKTHSTATHPRGEPYWSMAHKWAAAVMAGDGSKLSQLILSSSTTPAAALSVARSCVTLLEKAASSSTSTTAASGLGEDDSDTTTLFTLPGVQLLQPRGRFDLEFRKSGLLVTGKAGAVNASWGNVRHILRLPRPEGFNWGKNLDPNDPAGSDLLALPLKESVPFRKSKSAMILIQPDPKAKHAEVSVDLDGVSHQVSGSQGTVISELLKLLCGVRQCVPDRAMFGSRDSKSFVKCYHGVNEGSLFPLKQGLLFMKPALFLPKGSITEVVCGRGGSATTRYIDLVVGLEDTDNDSGGEPPSVEFSNIVREDLPSLQRYIQDALVAPRQREARRAAAAAAVAAAAATPSATPSEAGKLRQVNDEAIPDSRVEAAPARRASGSPMAREGSSGGREVNIVTTESGSDGRSSSGKRQISQRQKQEQQREGNDDDLDDEEEDDGDYESDEDFAPIAGDTDSDDDSGSDVESASDAGVNGHGMDSDGSDGSDDDSANDNHDDSADDIPHGGNETRTTADGDSGGNSMVEASNGKKRSRDQHTPAVGKLEISRAGGTFPTITRTAAKEEEEDTESDGDQRKSTKRQRLPEQSG